MYTKIPEKLDPPPVESFGFLVEKVIPPSSDASLTDASLAGPPNSQTIAPYNSYTLEMGKMSRNHFEASELIPMPRPKPNHEQKPNWRY